jgi:plastocyanin
VFVTLLLGWGIPQLASAETHEINMKDRRFSTETMRIKVGETVKWVNDDTELHQVISGRTLSDKDLGQPMNSGVMLWNAAYAYTFTKSGAYPYMCVIHRALDEHQGARSMVGEIIVTDGAESPR